MGKGKEKIDRNENDEKQTCAKGFYKQAAVNVLCYCYTTDNDAAGSSNNLE